MNRSRCTSHKRPFGGKVSSRAPSADAHCSAIFSGWSRSSCCATINTSAPCSTTRVRLDLLVANPGGIAARRPTIRRPDEEDPFEEPRILSHRTDDRSCSARESHRLRRATLFGNRADFEGIPIGLSTDRRSRPQVAGLLVLEEESRPLETQILDPLLSDFDGASVSGREHGDGTSLPDTDGCAHHQVSIEGRFFPVRGGTGGIARRASVIHRRDSAGSITSSISKCEAVFTALPRS